MKKIAVLRCLRVSASCAGSGCLRAMNEKTGAFERYGDDDLQSVAFFTCNGCKENKLPNQEGMAKKVERIKKLNPDALHLSNCTMPKDEDGNRVICLKMNLWRPALTWCTARIDFILRKEGGCDG